MSPYLIWRFGWAQLVLVKLVMGKQIVLLFDFLFFPPMIKSQITFFWFRFDRNGLNQQLIFHSFYAVYKLCCWNKTKHDVHRLLEISLMILKSWLYFDKQLHWSVVTNFYLSALCLVSFRATLRWSGPVNCGTCTNALRRSWGGDRRERRRLDRSGSRPRPNWTRIQVKSNITEAPRYKY